MAPTDQHSALLLAAMREAGGGVVAVCRAGQRVEHPASPLWLLSPLVRKAAAGQGELALSLPDFSSSTLSRLLNILQLDWAAADLAVLDSEVRSLVEILGIDASWSELKREAISDNDNIAITNEHVYEGNDNQPKDAEKSLSGKAYLLSCPYCQKQSSDFKLFKARELLRMHIGTIHFQNEMISEVQNYFDKNERCKDCSKVLNLESCKRRHLITNHTIYVDKILKIVQDIPFETIIKSKKKKIILPNAIQCPLCTSKLEGSKPSFRMHLVKQHFNAEITEEILKYFDENEKCKECDKVVGHKADKKEHILIYHETDLSKKINNFMRIAGFKDCNLESNSDATEDKQKPISKYLANCPHCQKEFFGFNISDCQKKLRYHMGQVHHQSQMSLEIQKFFDGRAKCKECGIIFSQEALKKKHLISNHSSISVQIRDFVRTIQIRASIEDETLEDNSNRILPMEKDEPESFEDSDMEERTPFVANCSYCQKMISGLSVSACQNSLRLHMGAVHYQSQMSSELQKFFGENGKCKECGSSYQKLSEKKRHLSINHSYLADVIREFVMKILIKTSIAKETIENKENELIQILKKEEPNHLQNKNREVNRLHLSPVVELTKEDIAALIDSDDEDMAFADIIQNKISEDLSDDDDSNEKQNGFDLIKENLIKASVHEVFEANDDDQDDDQKLDFQNSIKTDEEENQQSKSAGESLSSLNHREFINKKINNQIKSVIESTKDGWKCKKCCKLFNCLSTLKNHAETHFEDIHIPCNQCDKVFKQRKKLYRHMRVHNKQNL